MIIFFHDGKDLLLIASFWTVLIQKKSKIAENDS